jgi:hypothetical protein
MQFEDMEAQCMLWRKLNVVVENKGLGALVFKGFMVDIVSKLECYHLVLVIFVRSYQ